MNDTEKELASLNSGKMARIIMSELDPILEKRREECLARFKQAYREATLDISKSLACAAELCTLEDIENDFKRKMIAADRITKGRLNARSNDTTTN